MNTPKLISTPKPDIHCYETANALIESAAHLIAERIKQHIADHGSCRLALAGGNTPRPIYQRLAREDLAKTIEWSCVHFFWGDERCVPEDDSSSNYNMAYTTLLSHVPVVADNVHRIPAQQGAGAAASRYAKTLGDEPLDIVLLGMGNDGHVASLFPYTPNLDTNERVISTISPVPPVERVSISLREINAAAEVYLLVSGPDKAKRLAEVLQQLESSKAVLPAARVLPQSKQLHWLCDSAATQKM